MNKKLEWRATKTTSVPPGTKTLVIGHGNVTLCQMKTNNFK